MSLAVVGRLVGVLTLPVLDDEAYYWTWSRHLQWGYLDHPPGVAALVAGSTRLLGDAPWAMRLPSLLLAAATAWVVFRLTADLYGPHAARRSQWLFHSVPLFIAGGVVVSPDAPLVFLWAVAAWASWRALQGHHRSWWLVGAACGVGMQTKYSMGFLLPALAWLLLRHPTARRRWEPYAAAALALLLFLPNLLWNAQNGWQTFRFVVERAPWVRAGVAGNFLLSAGGVLLYLSPLLGVLLLAAPWSGHTAADRFLRLLCVPTLLAALLAALVGKFKPHYIAPVALLGVPALAAWEAPPLARWRSAAAALGAVQSLASVAVGLLALQDPAVLADQRGWDRVAEEVLRRAPAGSVVVTTTYQNAGQLSYALREQVPVAVLPGPHTFDQWSPLAAYAGRPALVVHDAASPVGHEGWCRSPQRLPDLVYPDPRRPLRTFVFVRCEVLSWPPR
ncbi:MAG: glycosyltransferase family 39 protein [Armatimonadota bacterium]|nr:glycosyltransferase family 39 protein [Armatimonadota bacterium]MDW8156063.1 glycosyltransferase family 39 protein [Armatimonadota bacterium]